MFDDGSVTDRHFSTRSLARHSRVLRTIVAPRPAISRGSLAIAFQPRAYHIRA